MLLTTGRRLYHYHTGTMTRRVRGLVESLDREYVRIHPDDAKESGIEDSQPVSVTSRRGTVLATARLTARVPRGLVFMDSHFGEAPTNELTSAALDPESRMAELKVCAVRIEKAASLSEGEQPRAA